MTKRIINYAQGPTRPPGVTRVAWAALVLTVFSSCGFLILAAMAFTRTLPVADRVTDPIVLFGASIAAAWLGGLLLSGVALLQRGRRRLLPLVMLLLGIASMMFWVIVVKMQPR